MSTFPWLTVTMAIPAAGALVLAVMPGASAGASEDDQRVRNQLAKVIALVFSLLTLAVTIAMIVSFKPGGPAFQFTQTYQWIPQFGVHYAVGVDGIALVLIGMTAVLMPVVILASWHDADPVPETGEAGEVTAAGSAGSGPTAPRSAGSGPTAPRSAGSGPTAPPRRSAKTYL